MRAVVIFYHPECAAYGRPGHPERPGRVITTVAYLEDNLPTAEWRQPGPAPEAALRLAHSDAHLRRLLEPRDFDGDTPYYDDLYRHARLSAGAGVSAIDLALAGHPVFCLMRPPGHHATADQAMGFCYLNNVAVAALAARQRGVARVAIWDFDAHHGNGTEAILAGADGIVFVSVHQYPGYPGTGSVSTGNCRNYPVAPGTPAAAHMETLRRSWEEVQAFAPELLLVSAGFDAYAGDPLTDLCLRRDDFATLGRWLGEAAFPVAALLEGGYSADLPGLVGAFLESWLHG